MGMGVRMMSPLPSSSPPHVPHTEHLLLNEDNGLTCAGIDTSARTEIAEDEDVPDIEEEEEKVEEEEVASLDGDRDVDVDGFSALKIRSKILSASCRLHLLPYRIDFDCDFDSDARETHEGMAAAMDLGSTSGIDLQLPRGQSLVTASILNSNSNSNSAGLSAQANQIDASRKRHGDRQKEKDKEREKERLIDLDYSACEYVQQYGAYLNLDLAAACSSLVKLPMALDAILLLTGADQQLDKLSSTLGKATSVLFRGTRPISSFTALFIWSFLVAKPYHRIQCMIIVSSLPIAR